MCLILQVKINKNWDRGRKGPRMVRAPRSCQKQENSTNPFYSFNSKIRMGGFNGQKLKYVKSLRIHMNNHIDLIMVYHYFLIIIMLSSLSTTEKLEANCFFLRCNIHTFYFVTSCLQALINKKRVDTGTDIQKLNNFFKMRCFI